MTSRSLRLVGEGLLEIHEAVVALRERERAQARREREKAAAGGVVGVLSGGHTEAVGVQRVVAMMAVFVPGAVGAAVDVDD